MSGSSNSSAEDSDFRGHDHGVGVLMRVDQGREGLRRGVGGRGMAGIDLRRRRDALRRLLLQGIRSPIRQGCAIMAAMRRGEERVEAGVEIVRMTEENIRCDVMRMERRRGSRIGRVQMTVTGRSNRRPLGVKPSVR